MGSHLVHAGHPSGVPDREGFQGTLTVFRISAYAKLGILVSSHCTVADLVPKYLAYYPSLVRVLHAGFYLPCEV
jgi:hypothetical protein